MSLTLTAQIVWLFLLALPVACVTWTVTHEEIFREPRERCEYLAKHGRTLVERKLFYPITCEYCFSHYVALIFMVLTGYKLLLPDWRGYLLAWFALVFVANFYMSAFGRIRLEIKRERVEIEEVKREVDQKELGPTESERAA